MASITTIHDDVLELLGDVSEYVLDETVSEVMINPDLRVFVERGGRKFSVNAKPDAKSLYAAAVRIARQNREEIDERRPIFNGRFGDGSSRVCIVIPPASPDGPLWSIRKFPKVKWTAWDLISGGSLPEEVYAELKNAVAVRETILLAGGPGTGKTTLLEILARLIPEDDRIALIEKPSEIQLSHPNVFRLEANDETGVTMASLIETVLRLLPSRVIFGEVRGPEAADLLEVLNTGHPGSFTTIHANSARLALSRLTTLALSGNAQYVPICRVIGDVIRYVVHLNVRSDGKRFVSDLIRVKGYSTALDEFEIEQVFGRKSI